MEILSFLQLEDLMLWKVLILCKLNYRFNTKAIKSCIFWWKLISWSKIDMHINHDFYFYFLYFMMLYWYLGCLANPGDTATMVATDSKWLFLLPCEWAFHMQTKQPKVHTSKLPPLLGSHLMGSYTLGQQFSTGCATRIF